MHLPAGILATRVQSAVRLVLGAEFGAVDPEVRKATRSEFGHFQSNVALRLAKATARSPMALARAISEHLPPDDVCASVEVAAPGFLNIRLSPEYLGSLVTDLLADDRLGVKGVPGVRVVVDYSSPNIAKQMQVWHLRSTLIGDCLARVLAYQGYEVVRQNHVGDWGTQFGMLIEFLMEQELSEAELDLDAVVGLYARAYQMFTRDAQFAARARARVVQLQGGDLATVRLWRRLVDVSLDAFQAIYRRLGCTLLPSDVAGESSYNDALAQIVDDLVSQGVARPSRGALCVFPEGFTTKAGKPLPVIVRKRDGAYNYATTDLAALRHRVDALRASRIVYVTDSRQKLHFAQVLAVARMAGWLPSGIRCDHVAFGSVLDEAGKPFKTRSGRSIALAALLDLAEERARSLVEDRSPDLTEAQREETARAVGIGAVKYADLMNDCSRDYAFSVDRMVAMDGRTGPYLQYAHARLSSLLVKAGGATERAWALDHPAEQRLALALTDFGSVVTLVGDRLAPHHLCAYLYDLATALSAFYESCPVIKAPEPTRSSRLALCSATQRVLARGLDLLGIESPKRM